MTASTTAKRGLSWLRSPCLPLAIAVVASTAAGRSTEAPAVSAPTKQRPVSYRSVNVDGLSIFYRETGPSDGPVLLLLHGFPSSSRMFDPAKWRRRATWHARHKARIVPRK